MNGTSAFLQTGNRDCPNHSAFITKAEHDSLKMKFQQMVANGVLIPPSIARIAQQLALDK